MKYGAFWLKCSEKTNPLMGNANGTVRRDPWILGSNDFKWLQSWPGGIPSWPQNLYKNTQKHVFRCTQFKHLQTTKVMCHGQKDVKSWIVYPCTQSFDGNGTQSIFSWGFRLTHYMYMKSSMNAGISNPWDSSHFITMFNPLTHPHFPEWYLHIFTI